MSSSGTSANVIFICGKPASGKSTYAQQLASAAMKLFHEVLGIPFYRVGLLETSKLIEDWNMVKDQGMPSLLQAPSQSKGLREFMWQKFYHYDLAIVSGIREPFLLCPPEKLQANHAAKDMVYKSVIYLDAPFEKRKARFDIDKKRSYTFEQAEERAKSLGCEFIKDRASVVYTSEYDMSPFIMDTLTSILLCWFTAGGQQI
jgi:hypothetical protein